MIFMKLHIKTPKWRQSLVCWRLTPTFCSDPNFTAKLLSSDFQRKFFGFHCHYLLFWGRRKTLPVINGSLWIEQKALNHLIDALVITSLHTSFQALFLLRQLKKEPVKPFQRRWRLPGFILPDSTFVLNPSLGKRLFKPSCSQNKLTFGFLPIVFENHSPPMTMMQSYKLASILVAQKCKLCFAQTQRGGGKLQRSGVRHVDEYKHSRVQKTEDIFTTARRIRRMGKDLVV